MKEFQIKILRYNPEEDKKPKVASYQIFESTNATCLEALIGIYVQFDSSLAFRYSCRYQKCGLCSCMVNGKARCLCRVRLKDEVELEPLKGLPILRDLVIDRSFLLDFLSRYKVYISQKPLFDNVRKFIMPEIYYHLIKCKECLCCISHCPQYNFNKNPFFGPYFFVKLAQLLFDPRNRIDRIAQAKMIGIEQCKNCGKCYCPYGIKIFDFAILPLIGFNCNI